VLGRDELQAAALGARARVAYREQRSRGVASRAHRPWPPEASGPASSLTPDGWRFGRQADTLEATDDRGAGARPRRASGGTGCATGERTHPLGRLEREERTIAAMVTIYCRDHHSRSRAAAGGLCPDCAELLAYARRRLAACPYGAAKPTCVRCATHCYRPAMREQVRVVMRYAGPRMLRKHPLLAVAHLVDGRRRPPLPR